ncbi:MAG: VOC family protein [Acidobacteria bacterium]|nr:VOC family protein [Acidobacteriota bacterium]MBK8146816.1 VOC family protein [Acidobacteriota bacterium]MBK8813057.1 VOC family protein [Acidobacteriota bacterium]
MNFHSSSPILRVSDLVASLDYYNNILGFATDWGHESGFASVSRQAANLMLCENDQGNFGTWVYIGVGDVLRLHEELTAKGAIVKLPPTNYEWAMEIHVADPDGNVIRFGSEPDTSRPFDDWVTWYKQ